MVFGLLLSASWGSTHSICQHRRCPSVEVMSNGRCKGKRSLLSQLERPTKQMREAEQRLKAIPQFCFPDAKDWSPVSDYTR